MGVVSQSLPKVVTKLKKNNKVKGDQTFSFYIKFAPVLLSRLREGQRPDPFT